MKTEPMSYDANPNMDHGYGATYPTFANDVRVVVLTKEGVSRVLGGKPGMTFMVDSSTKSPDPTREPNMHVRDYSHKNTNYPPRHPRYEFCIWTLAQEDYEPAVPGLKREVGKLLSYKIYYNIVGASSMLLEEIFQAANEDEARKLFKIKYPNKAHVARECEEVSK